MDKMVWRSQEVEAIIYLPLKVRRRPRWKTRPTMNIRHRFELADSERKRKENEQGGLVAEVTMAEVFRGVPSCPLHAASVKLDELKSQILGPLVCGFSLSFSACTDSIDRWCGCPRRPLACTFPVYR